MLQHYNLPSVKLRGPNLFKYDNAPEGHENMVFQGWQEMVWQDWSGELKALTSVPLNTSGMKWNTGSRLQTSSSNISA